MATKRVTIDFGQEFQNLRKFKSSAPIQTYFGCTKEAAEEIWKGRREYPNPDELVKAIVNIGGRGSAKTRTGLYTLYHQLRAIPDNLGLVVRKNWANMHTSIVSDFVALMKDLTNGHPELLIDGPHRREGYYEIIVKTSDPKKPSKLIFKPEPDASSERDVEDALKGPEYGIVVLDELSQLRKVTFETLYDNLRRKNVPRPRLIGLTNPLLRGHWLYDMAKEAEQKQFEGERPRILFVRSKMTDNPFLHENYIPDMIEKYKDDPIKYAMYVEGRDGIEINGIPVYKGAFSTQRNISELKFQAGIPLSIGLDFGVRANVAIFGQVFGRGYINILGELMITDASLENFGQCIKDYIIQRWRDPSLYNSANLYGDPNTLQQRGTQTGELTSSYLMQKWGRSPKFLKRSVALGIDGIRDLLTNHGLDGIRPRMLIDERYCPELVLGFLAGYRWKTSGETVKPEPYKDEHYDHYMDAVRYLCDNSFGPVGTSFGRKKGPKTAKGMTPRRINRR